MIARFLVVVLLVLCAAPAAVQAQTQRRGPPQDAVEPLREAVRLLETIRLSNLEPGWRANACAPGSPGSWRASATARRRGRCRPTRSRRATSRRSRRPRRWCPRARSMPCWSKPMPTCAIPRSRSGSPSGPSSSCSKCPTAGENTPTDLPRPRDLDSPNYLQKRDEIFRLMGMSSRIGESVAVG